MALARLETVSTMGIAVAMIAATVGKWRKSRLVTADCLTCSIKQSVECRALCNCRTIAAVIVVDISNFFMSCSSSVHDRTDVRHVPLRKPIIHQRSRVSERVLPASHYLIPAATQFEPVAARRWIHRTNGFTTATSSIAVATTTASSLQSASDISAEWSVVGKLHARNAASSSAWSFSHLSPL
jgi:hypothetical protein